jgi:uncharacterized membrane protein HdeD (DUF308 family)
MRGGVAAVGVRIFFVASPHETLSTFAVIAGIFLLVDGAFAIVASIFGRGEGRGLLAVVGVSAIAGLILIKHPFNTPIVFTMIIGLSTLAVIIGIVLILRGILFIAAGWQLHKLTHSSPGLCLRRLL